MDVMEFLILRGHNRHVPQGGVSEFPDAVLNAKRLDLYNLYREVRFQLVYDKFRHLQLLYLIIYQNSCFACLRL